MARIKGADAIKAAVKKYGSSEFQFFTLKDDQDTAKVRFLHTDDEDMDIFVVHKVEIDGKEKYVECLQEEGCPFCAAYGKPSIKVFIFLVKSDDLATVYLWERGPGIVDELMGFIKKKGNLNNRFYEILRHGKKGDTKTKYQFFPDDKLSDEEEAKIQLPERPKVEGKTVLIWDKDEMNAYIEENTVQTRDRGRNAQQNRNGF